MEETLRAPAGAGFTPAQAVRATTTAYFFTLGSVTEEQGVEPQPGERRGAVRDRLSPRPGGPEEPRENALGPGSGRLPGPMHGL
jgi:hypothetical protein